MSIPVKAPVRLDFAGGWTDVPHFAAQEGGAVLNAAITQYTHVSCVRGGDCVRLRAPDLGLDFSYGIGASLAYDGKLDLHKAALRLIPLEGGLELASRSDVPPGSGLGASGSLAVALLYALALADNKRLPATEIAEIGFLLEARELGLMGGRQDQLGAALGGFHELRFNAGGSVPRRLAVAQDAARDLAAHTLVIYTGESHFSSATHRRVWDDYESGDRRVRAALREMRELVTPAAAALVAADWRSLAEFVDRNWEAQKRLHPSITTPRIRALEGAVRDAGAWGIKATGAGAGGCVLIMAPPARRRILEEIARGLRATVIEWSFDFEGVRDSRG